MEAVVFRLWCCETDAWLCAAALSTVRYLISVSPIRPEAKKFCNVVSTESTSSSFQVASKMHSNASASSSIPLSTLPALSTSFQAVNPSATLSPTAASPPSVSPNISSTDTRPTVPGSPHHASSAATSSAPALASSAYRVTTHVTTLASTSQWKGIAFKIGTVVLTFALAIIFGVPAWLGLRMQMWANQKEFYELCKDSYVRIAIDQLVSKLTQYKGKPQGHRPQTMPARHQRWRVTAAVSRHEAHDLEHRLCSLRPFVQSPTTNRAMRFSR